MGIDPSTPAPRNLSSEFGSITGLTPDLVSAQQQLGNYQVNTLYPEMAAQERTATDLQENSQARALAKLGPRYQATLGALSPLYAAGQSAIAGQLAANGQQTPLQGLLGSEAMTAGPSALTSQLQSQATNELNLGSQMSPDQIRAVTQATDAGFAARGIAGSNPAIFAEALNRDQYGQQLLQQRQAFAGNVNQQAITEQNANRAFQSGVQGQQQQALGQAQQFSLAAQQAGQNALAPVLGFMGQQAAVQPGQAAMIANASSNAFAPAISYGQDLFNTNFNAQAASDIDAANNASALWGAAIQSVGEVVGGAMKSGA